MVYADLVHKGYCALVQHVSKDVVDHALERSVGVRQSEGHEKVFEEAVTATESGFPFIPFFYTDQVIAVFRVYL